MPMWQAGGVLGILGQLAGATSYTGRMNGFEIIFGILAAVLAIIAAWLAARLAGAKARVEAAGRDRADLEGQIADARARADESTQRVVSLSEDLARTRQELADADLTRQQMEKSEQRLREAFESLSSKALKTSGEELLKLAEQRFKTQHQQSEAELEKRKAAVEQLVKPIGETLRKTDEKLAAIEKSRVEAFAKLGQHITDINAANSELREETTKLGRALREPHVRGRYGEIQLQRVAELAGMTAYCDFATQASVRDEEGNLLRPDMVVRLPNERVVAVDAKTNIHAYMEALEGDKTVEEVEACLDRFARHVAEQVTSLSRKKYWSHFDGSPDFVVMFIPGDQFLDAALSRRPGLLEHAAEQDVILASPATLIGLLRAVAVGWREHKLAQEAKDLFELGKELHGRAAVAFEHAAKVGESLGKAVDRYNKFASSVDSRLLPTLRKFEETGVRSSKDVPGLPEVTIRPRMLEGQAIPSEE